MMFQKLAAMMKQGDTFAISAALQADGQMCLTIHAVGTFTNKALSTPLSMVATPDELDAGMADELGRWVGARLSLREQIDAANLILEAARKEAAATASKAAQRPAAGKAKPAAPAKAAAAAGADGDDGDDDDNEAGGGGEGGVTAAPKASGPEVSGEQAAVNLFG
jgi:PRTRC genetic system protein E